MRIVTTAWSFTTPCCGVRRRCASYHYFHVAFIILIVILHYDGTRGLLQAGRKGGVHIRASWGIFRAAVTSSATAARTLKSFASSRRHSFMINKSRSSSSLSRWTETSPSASMSNDDSSHTNQTFIVGLKRRHLFKRVAGSAAGLVSLPTALLPQQAHAGEVGTRITKAVTTSELGISVRRAVVQGAQVADSIDAQWEQFSDRFHLGTARNNNNKNKVDDLPNLQLQPLDVKTASKLLYISNQAFLDATRKYEIQSKDVQQQIVKVAQTVLPAFERASSSTKQINNNGNGGVDNDATIVKRTLPLPLPPSITSSSSVLTLTTSESPSSPFSSACDHFNFLCYTQYKAYLDLILLQNNSSIDFQSFSNDFESRVGNQVLDLLLVESSSSPKHDQQLSRGEQISLALDRIDQLSHVLIDKGFISRIDISLPRQRPGETRKMGYNNNDKKISRQQGDQAEDDLLDWTEGLTDYLQWSIALNGDISLGSQLLLQEQGFRLYPSFIRCAITSLLRQSFASSSSNGDKMDASNNMVVEVTDYYMDTNYNSDPNKFEVKQVLLNVVLDTK